MLKQVSLCRNRITPEKIALDEPITTLGFVGSVVVDGGAVSVRLRLPTRGVLRR